MQPIIVFCYNEKIIRIAYVDYNLYYMYVYIWTCVSLLTIPSQMTPAFGSLAQSVIVLASSK